MEIFVVHSLPYIENEHEKISFEFRIFVCYVFKILTGLEATDTTDDVSVLSCSNSSLARLSAANNFPRPEDIFIQSIFIKQFHKQTKIRHLTIIK